MADRTVAVTLKASVLDYVSGMKQAATATVGVKTAMHDAATAAVKHRETLKQVGVGFLAVGATAAAGLALVVKAATEFGAKMAQLQTLSHASSGEMQQLSTAAMSAGAAYGFSATQVADAEIELTKAGISVKDQLGGALTGALTLAAAGQINVADATQIATVAMTQFGLSAKDVPHLADLLAAGADKALGSVGDLGAALSNGGLQAHNMGLTIDQTVGTLAAFANSGLIGAEAGTQLRSMFIQIQKPTAAARATMDEYGISMYNANGKFVGMTALAGQLHEKLLPLPQAQRNAALATIFGSYAINGASVAMREGSKGITDWINKVNDQGFAAQQARGKLDSLAGSVQKLSAQFQTDLIKAGTGSQSGLKGLIDGATAVLKAYGDLPPVMQGVATDAATAVAAIGLLGGAALIAVPKVIALKLAIDGLDASSKAFLVGGTVAAGFVAIAAAAAYAEQKVAEFNYQQEHALTKGPAVKKDQVAAAAATASHANTNSQSSMGLGMGLGEALDKQAEAQNKLTRANHAGADSESKVATAASKSATAHHMAAIATGLAASQAGLSSSAYTAASKALAKQAEAAKLSADKMRLAGDYAGLLKLQLDRLNGAAISDAEQQAAFASALDSLSLKMKSHAAVLRGDSRAAVENRGAIASLAAQGQSAVESYANQATSQADLRHKFEQTRSAMIDQAVHMGANRKAATQLVDTYFKFPKKVETKFNADTATATAKTHELSAAAKAWAKKFEAQLLANDVPAKDAHKRAMALAHEWQRQHPKATLDADNTKAKTATAEAAAAATVYAQKQYLAQLLANGVPAGKAIQMAKDAAKAFGALDPKPTLRADPNPAIAAARRAQFAIDSLHGKSVGLNVVYHQVGAPAGKLANSMKAAGGSIDGPGPKGVDSVPILAAPGEHMLTAGEVDRLGGQAAAYRLRAAIRSGVIPRYAEGGAIPRYSTSPGMPAHTAAGGVFTGDLYLDSGEFLGKVRGEVNQGIARNEHTKRLRVPR